MSCRPNSVSRMCFSNPSWMRTGNSFNTPALATPGPISLWGFDFMAWIQFHASTVKRLPKFKAFRRALSWSTNEGLGFLGSLWAEVLEVSEDGDITAWEKQDIADAGNTDVSAQRVWDALVSSRWLDIKGERVLVHDWLQTASFYLTKKYGTGR